MNPFRRRHGVPWITFVGGCLMISILAHGAAVGAGRTSEATRPPNVIIVFLDDSGWADFHPFGQPPYPTPNVQRLAAEGCRFDRFYVPQAVCSASRAALLSGCFPERTKVFGAHGPGGRGLEPRFATLGEVLRRRGYATAVFGKWHIGDQPDTRPAARGFDESAGLMVSNDMWAHHPESPAYWGQWPLQYWVNGRVTIESMMPRDQTKLTAGYTRRAVQFIRRHRDRPFFLYLPHSMPHVPLFASPRYAGRSGAGLYGDVMMELDGSIGELLRAVKSVGVEEHTMVVLTSDNGPWISYGSHAGQTPFREAKGTSFDGGTRSACLIKFPGRLPAGHRSTQAFCSVDLLPTIAHLSGAALPGNPIDGRNVWDWITEKPGARNPHAYYPFTTDRTFEGVMSGDGRWKLHLPHRYRTLERPGRDGQAGKYRIAEIGLALYDLENDPRETRDVREEHPEVVTRLQALAEEHRRRFFSPESP